MWAKIWIVACACACTCVCCVRVRVCSHAKCCTGGGQCYLTPHPSGTPLVLLLPSYHQPTNKLIKGAQWAIRYYLKKNSCSRQRCNHCARNDGTCTSTKQQLDFVTIGVRILVNIFGMCVRHVCFYKALSVMSALWDCCKKSNSAWNETKWKRNKTTTDQPSSCPFKQVDNTCKGCKITPHM